MLKSPSSEAIWPGCGRQLHSLSSTLPWEVTPASCKKKKKKEKKVCRREGALLTVTC